MLSSGAAVAALLLSTHAEAQDIDNAEFFLGENGAIPFTVVANGAPRSCNEVSFAAIPGDPGHVIGRYNNTCNGPTFSIARYAIDWNARTLTLANIAFNTGGGNVPISKGDSVSTAYDATVMSYGGELWVAFECGGNLAGCQTASSCVGPMNASGVIDPARTNVVVLGNNSLGDGYLYSGSVPELLNFNGTPYIYWSAVKINAANTSVWANITGRGMKLTEAGGQLWNANTGTWVGSADPNNTVQVWGLEAGSTVTDLQGVFTNGTDIFMTAGVAGAGCAMPFWPPTCYSFSISKSSNPLATDTFKNGTQLPAGELPTNTHSYSRYIQDPEGRGYILGGYYTNVPGARPLPVSGGANAAYVAAFPIPQASSYFGPLGGNLAFPTSGTTIANQDGRLETFVVGTDHNVYHAWQATPGGAYSGFAPLAPAAMTSPTAQRNADGRLEVFAIGPAQVVWHIWQTSAGGAWAGGWDSLGGVATGGPAAERNVDGSLDVFVVGTTGAVFRNQQMASGWSGWVSLGGSAVGSPTVQRNADGRLELFVVGTDGALYHAWQAIPGGGWTPFASLGTPGGKIASPIVERNLDGRLEAFVVGAGDALFHTWQTAPNGNWNGAWASLGGQVTSPSVGHNADGRLEVFGVGSDRSIEHAWQATPGGAFGGWASLGGDFHGAAVAPNANGDLELTAIEFSGAVQHNAQTSTGWSGWSAIGGAALPYGLATVDYDAPIVVMGSSTSATTSTGATGTSGSNGATGTSGAGGAAASGAGGQGGAGASVSNGKTGCACDLAGGTPGESTLWLFSVAALAVGAGRRQRRRRSSWS